MSRQVAVQPQRDGTDPEKEKHSKPSHLALFKEISSYLLEHMTWLTTPPELYAANHKATLHDDTPIAPGHTGAKIIWYNQLCDKHDYIKELYRIVSESQPVQQEYYHFLFKQLIRLPLYHTQLKHDKDMDKKRGALLRNIEELAMGKQPNNGYSQVR